MKNESLYRALCARRRIGIPRELARAVAAAAIIVSFAGCSPESGGKAQTDVATAAM